jgi:hypothetical protein
VIDGKYYIVVENHAAADDQRHNLVRFFVDQDPFHVADVAERFETPDRGIVEDLALELGLTKVFCGDADAAGSSQGGYQSLSHVPQQVARSLSLPWLGL